VTRDKITHFAMPPMSQSLRMFATMMGLDPAIGEGACCGVNGDSAITRDRSMVTCEKCKEEMEQIR
jgi:hypothetical protein